MVGHTTTHVVSKLQACTDAPSCQPKARRLELWPTGETQLPYWKNNRLLEHQRSYYSATNKSAKHYTLLVSLLTCRVAITTRLRAGRTKIVPFGKPKEPTGWPLLALQFAAIILKNQFCDQRILLIMFCRNATKSPAYTPVQVSVWPARTPYLFKTSAPASARFCCTVFWHIASSRVALAVPCGKLQVERDILNGDD